MLLLLAITRYTNNCITVHHLHSDYEALPLRVNKHIVQFHSTVFIIIDISTLDVALVCPMPQSQVSASLENPHFKFNMFTIDRPTCARNQLSAFQVAHILCASWKVFVSSDVNVLTAWRPGARVVLSTTPCEHLSPSC